MIQAHKVAYACGAACEQDLLVFVHPARSKFQRASVTGTCLVKIINQFTFCVYRTQQGSQQTITG